MLQRLAAVRRQPIEPLVSFVFLAPLAAEQTLRLETPQQRVERAFVDRQPLLGQRLAQGVAVALGLQLREDGENEAAAPELELEVFEDVSVHVCPMRHILFSTHCTTYTV